MNNLNWIFDALGGLIIIGFIVQGVRKGASKTILPVFFNIVFVALAFLMSGILTESIYESAIQVSVKASLDESLEIFNIRDALRDEYYKITLIDNLSEKDADSILKAEKDMDSKLWKVVDINSGVGDNINDSECFKALNNIIKVTLQESLAETLPLYKGNYFDRLDESNREETFKLINMINADRRHASDYIMDNYIDSVMFKFVQLLVFVSTAAPLMTITSIVVSVAFKDKDMTSNGKADSAAGVFVEIINGVLILIVFALLIKILVYSEIKIDGIMDNQTLNNSYVFKYLYNIDKFMKN